MKITLIEPAMIKRDDFGEKPMFTLQPLTLGILAGLTPPGVEVEAIDDRIEAINYDEPRDLVGISVHTFTARRAYEIAAEFRRRNVRVVLGGYHPSLVPGEACQHADSIVIGEAEGVWATLLEDASMGKLKPLYRSLQRISYENVQVRRSIFKSKHYQPVSLVESARGCPHDCAYCAVSVFSGRKYRSRPVGEVATEISALREKVVLFADDNIVGNPQGAKALFQALIPLKIRWMGQASLAITRDPELLKLMQKSGCQGVLVGLETLNQENLRQIGKKWNTAGIGYSNALQAARDHGISIIGSFIIGLDEDTLETLDATVDFAIQQRFFAVLFNLLMPYPGTRLYAQMVQEDRLIYPSWWVDPRYTYGSVVFTPRHLSPQALAEKRISMYRRFYGIQSNLSRMLDFESNSNNFWKLMVFLGLNLTANKQEIIRCGKNLGSENE